METFHKLFGSLLSFVYHCFDRVVILAYLPLLTREENLVHFFRDVNGIWPITQEALRERTNRYRSGVDSYARDHGIPIEWAEKGVRKEEHVAPELQRMRRKNQFGVYYILRSMEVGPTFRCFQPRYPVEDPDYRILRRYSRLPTAWTRPPSSDGWTTGSTSWDPAFHAKNAKPSG